MCIGAAQSELSRNNGERFLAPGYACVPRAKWLHRYRDTVLPKGAHFGTRAMMGCRGLEKSARVRRRKEYTWSDFWTTRGRSGFLSPRHATQPQRGPYEVLGASRSTKPARSHFFPSCRRRHLRGDWVETQSIPWQVCLFSKSLVLLTF